MQRRGFALDLRGQLLVVVAAAWLLGMLLEAWGQAWIPAWSQMPSGLLLVGAAVACWCAIILWRSSRSRGQAWLIALPLACLLLGTWRYTTVSPVADPAAIRAYIGTKALVLDGSIDDEPRLEKDSSLLIVDTQQISLDGG